MVVSTPKLLLVDGHGLAFRAFFALPELNAPDGTPTQAIVGFFNMLLKFLEESEPERVGIVFDPKGPTQRHAVYLDYKAGRAPAPESFKVQLSLIQEILKKMGYPVLVREGIEADDLIISTAQAYASNENDVVILTADKDLLQIVGEHINVARPIKGVTTFKKYDLPTFTSEFPFPPSSIPDYLALVGDTVDNIPGVSGIGPKTAAKLLSTYGNLEGIYAHLEELPESLRKKLENGAHQVFESRKLVLPFPTEPATEEELKKGEIDRQSLEALCSRLSLRHIAQRLGIAKENDSFTPSSFSSSLSVKGSPLKNVELEEILGEKTLAMHWSGKGRYPCSFKLEEMFLVTEDGRFWTLREGSGACPPEFLEWTQKGQLLLWGYKEFLVASGIKRLYSNPWDAKIAHYLLHPDANEHGLNRLLGKECHGLDTAKGLFDGKTLFKTSSEQASLSSLMESIDVPLSPVLAGMELYGIGLDTYTMEELQKEVIQRLSDIEEKISREAGVRINLNSTKQVAWLLFEKKGLPHIKKTKTGYSTDVSVLEELAKLPSPQGEIPALLLEYREVSKILSGFITPFLSLRYEKTGAIHSTFDHTSTGTGRLSSRDPNVQNLPVFGEWAQRFRKALKPREEGSLFVAADYSQIELRVLAHLSGEMRLVEAFREGRDIHAQTASWIYGVLPEEITPEQRRFAKVVNFGLLYGMSVHGLAQRMGTGRSEAQNIIDKYFAALPNVKQYLAESLKEAKERGYTKTLFGRIRPLGEVTTIEGRGAGSIERVAINTPIQGTAADIAKKAMILLDEKIRTLFPSVHLVLQVHDSLICECPAKIASEFKEVLRKTMESVVELSVPLVADLKEGPTLADV